MEKTGFIYIWRDRKRNMYYVGCHWGTEDDGYICSSRRMRNAYQYRPEDFKRRILQRDISKNDLLKEEFRWLSMIQNEELNKKYYNNQKNHFGHWAFETNQKEKDVRKRISKAVKDSFSTPEVKQILSNAQKRRFANPKTIHPMKGRTHSEETKAKIREKRAAQVIRHSDETRKKQSEKRIGIKFSDEHRRKLSEARKRVANATRLQKEANKTHS